MSSLAKQILQNKRHHVKTDDLGIPKEDELGDSVLKRPQYFVARALLLETKNPRYDPDSTMRLHLRQDMIYQHNREVDENPNNFYRLTGIGYKVENQLQLLFWTELKRRLPHLNPHIYKICDSLWWDKNNGEIIEGSNDEIRKKTIKGAYGEIL